MKPGQVFFGGPIARVLSRRDKEALLAIVANRLKVMKRAGHGSKFRDVVLFERLRETTTGEPYELDVFACVGERDEVMVIDAADWSVVVQSVPGHHWRMDRKAFKGAKP